MSFIADFHTHSFLSRATSKECNLEGLYRWAQLKGVRVIGTGDFTHPAWFAELQDKLVPDGTGLYQLAPPIAKQIDQEIPTSCRGDVRFIITGEISSIYKRDDRVRKVHTLLTTPDLDTAARVNIRLDQLGNIKSDGRPILGLDPRNLMEIVLEANARSMVIPAHIWTPWFSMLGSKSGFDSPAECFGDLARYVFAVETGLSSDPPMNWRVSALDGLTLMSNSDLHSPANMGRNANIFHCDVGYDAIFYALHGGDPSKCGGTIDLFPEEGKYHHDGHRKCGVVMEPEESLAHNCLCPKCGKPLVLGVLHRVVALADRPKDMRPDGVLPNEYIIPLAELLSELFACGVKSKRVQTTYHRLLNKYGNEFTILRDLDAATLENEEPKLLAEAISRVRGGNVIRQAGYDGEYGVIRVFGDGERERLESQGFFFDMSQFTPMAVAEANVEYPAPAQELAPCPEPIEATEVAADAEGQLLLVADHGMLSELTDEQRAAAAEIEAPTVIVAGPGTGKTRTLTHRIAHLVADRNVPPTEILAITFTNRAAGEMAARLEALLGERARDLTVCTFHTFCLRVLREHATDAGLHDGFLLVDQSEAADLLQTKLDSSRREAEKAVEAIANARRDGKNPSDLPGYAELTAALAERQMLQLDELIPRCVDLLRYSTIVLTQYRMPWICVDEYQDVNRMQYELIRLLSPEGHGLCVIGDPDQAIYGFRGADVKYFLDFTNDFPGARTFELSRNFRSAANIVTAAGSVMAPGRSSMSVVARSLAEGGPLIQRYEAPSVAAEAEQITHEIEKLLGGTALFSVDTDRVDGVDDCDVSMSDIAVLVRLKSLLGPVAEAITRLGLPVQIVGDADFASMPGATHILSLLRKRYAELGDGPAIDIVTNMDCAHVDRTVRSAMDQCRTLVKDYTGSLAQFIDHLLLRREPDDYATNAERITLMTQHASKGLEFPVVFVAGCEDGVMPLVRPDKQGDIEEERRLLYVAMTRAKQLLYITSSAKRALFGMATDREPSRFLAEIPLELLHRPEQHQTKKKPESTQLEFDF